MQHISSISSSETRAGSMTIQAASKLEEYSQSRFRFNAAEFKRSIRHSSTQTDPSNDNRVTRPTIDKGDQADMMTSVITQLQDEIRNAYYELKKERERCADRERLLIAQMNAIRDQQAMEEKHLTETAKLVIACKQSDVEPKKIPVGLEVVGLSLVVNETGDSGSDGRYLGYARADVGGIYRNGIEFGFESLSIVIPRNASQCVVHFEFVAKSDDASQFPVVLGEWMSPAFVPSLKERGKAEILRAILPLIGTIDFELMVL